MPQARPPSPAPGTLRPGGTSLVLAGRRTLLKGTGSPAWALAPTSLARPPTGPRKGTKGPPGESAEARLTSPGAGSRPPPAAGRRGSRSQARTFRWPEALWPALPTVSHPGQSSQTAPVQFRAGRRQSQARPRPSSSQEAAGRAGRAGQAAQEKPRLVPPLPPRGPGDREARASS